MIIKHKLASKKDKKCTILASDILKIFNTSEELINLQYLDYGFSATYHKSRNGKTYYCDSIFPINIPMPNIGNPIEHNIILLPFTTTNQIKIFSNMNLTNEFELIRDWAKQKGIYEKGDTKTQFLKLIEEVGELGKAILTKDIAETKDAIGDIIVVLTNLTELANKDIFVKEYYEDVVGDGGRPILQQESLDISIEDCINSAYAVIAKRTGKMENGTFVKDTI
jgi:NTP pyrophosphatase (non-canonical NTP hydrolase)